MAVSYDEEYFVFEINGREIKAALTSPRTGEAHWGIVVIPGSGPSDVDGNYPENPIWPGKSHVYADLGRQLAGHGHAVLRFGRGDAVSVDETKSAGHNTFGERRAIAAAAVQSLREKVPGLKKVAVAGHSEGSVVGSLLLTEQPDLGVVAFISLSGPAWRFFDLMLRQMKSFVKDDMMEFGGLKISFSLYERSIEVVRNGEGLPNELKDVRFGFHGMPEEGKRYLRDYNAVDNSAVMARVPCPVLIVQGGLDSSVFPENVDKLMAARSASPYPTDKILFPDLDHMYKKSRPGMPFVNLDDQDVDERVSRGISDWLINLPW